MICQCENKMQTKIDEQYNIFLLCTSFDSRRENIFLKSERMYNKWLASFTRQKVIPKTMIRKQCIRKYSYFWVWSNMSRLTEVDEKLNWLQS